MEFCTNHKEYNKIELLPQNIKLSPSLKNTKDRTGVALDGRVKGEDTDLASSTLLADENSRDIFGMVISYTVKVSIVKVLKGGVVGFILG